MDFDILRFLWKVPPRLFAYNVVKSVSISARFKLRLYLNLPYQCKATPLIRFFIFILVSWARVINVGWGKETVTFDNGKCTHFKKATEENRKRNGPSCLLKPFCVSCTYLNTTGKLMEGAFAHLFAPSDLENWPDDGRCAGNADVLVFNPTFSFACDAGYRQSSLSYTYFAEGELFRSFPNTFWRCFVDRSMCVQLLLYLTVPHVKTMGNSLWMQM